ncbi:hypothetical protein GLOTRDRAFT_132667 [Gloeophyllum trabeum ATCC 11539]|uniref:Uncharacterized protein n=1 Tax=Gloeophyllum trabeum (strain ATCC 11539 / FP-39264 / Madison 617) TaxID=670483 RepID=S7RC93_GLOTA|nr:uncharacterized protein GLOTRDRAFT_132667 [Gloeophyllum trabeum ATCC 11539]EPQ51855.1 hypothetical protein GLOTRDRAFT_132667 [Gloeophyllum trabeum ATCC 11539]
MSEISSLLDTLTSAIDVFKAKLARQQLPESSLTMSESHPIDEISYIPPPAMYEARRLAVASMLLLENPVEAVMNTVHASAEIQGVPLSAEIEDPDTFHETRCGGISTSGPRAKESLARRRERRYVPVPLPPYIPAHLCDCWSEDHSTNVLLITLCNGVYPVVRAQVVQGC